MLINNLKIRKFKNVDIITAIDICTNFNLFVKDWRFESLFENPQEIEIIYIGYINGLPVGCLLIEKEFCEDYYDFGVFVKKDCRKKGIGKKLVNKAIADFHGKQLIYSEGTDGSLEFFEKCFQTT